MKNPHLFWIIFGLLLYPSTVLQASSQTTEDPNANPTDDGVTGSVPVPLTTINSTGSVPVPLTTINSTGSVPVPLTTINSTGSVPVPLTTINSTGSVPVPLTTINSTGSVPVPTTTNNSTESQCTTNSCGTELAQCVNLEGNYTCRCPYGYYFQAKTCVVGKAFPLQLVINATSISSDERARFTHVYNLVQKSFSDTFNGTDDNYVEAVLLQIQSQLVKRSIEGNLTADVIAMFTLGASMNKTEFINRLSTSLDNDRFFNITIVSQCAFYGCDVNTTVCEDNMGQDFPVCNCLPGYYKHSILDKTCKGCNETCSAVNLQLCDMKNASNPVCKCFPNHFMDKITKNCKPCSFGYSGDACNENDELVTVVVGVIAVILVLGLVGGIIGISLRGKRNYDDNIDKHELIKRNSNEDEKSLAGFNKPFVFPTVTISPKLQEAAYANHYTDYNSGSENARPKPTKYSEDDEDPWNNVNRHKY